MGLRRCQAKHSPRLSAAAPPQSFSQQYPPMQPTQWLSCGLIYSRYPVRTWQLHLQQGSHDSPYGVTHIEDASMAILNLVCHGNPTLPPPTSPPISTPTHPCKRGPHLSAQGTLFLSTLHCLCSILHFRMTDWNITSLLAKR